MSELLDRAADIIRQVALKAETVNIKSMDKARAWLDDYNSRAPAGLLGRVPEGYDLAGIGWYNLAEPPYYEATLKRREFGPDRDRYAFGTGSTPELAVDDAKGRIK